MDDLAVIILAAGEGKRFNRGNPSMRPKVLLKIAGKSIITYSLETIKKFRSGQVIIVVGHKAEELKKALGSKYEYALQEKALGTADAVRCAVSVLKSKISKVLVLYGDDSAFYNFRTLKSVVSKHDSGKYDLTFITLFKRNPSGLGRIIRTKGGSLLKIVEEKIATSEERKICEVNDGCYVFEKNWLRENVSKVNMSESGEYYLTDLVAIALSQGKKVAAFRLKNENEWASVNFPKELEYADQLMRKKVEN